VLKASMLSRFFDCVSGMGPHVFMHRKQTWSASAEFLTLCEEENSDASHLAILNLFIHVCTPFYLL
jgi:hypothetical protein